MSRIGNMLRNLAGGGPREAGPPRSSSGASSFHLIWEMPPGTAPEARLIEVSAVIEILIPPRSEALYFWALQVEFFRGGICRGGGHTGLQWNRRYPECRAVNWGGYASAGQGGGILTGTKSSLPGFRDDPNTVAYQWRPGCPYRFRVFRSPDVPDAWRSEVTDLLSGISTVVRDLFPGCPLDSVCGPVSGPDSPESPNSRDSPDSGLYLGHPIVWSEVFADCDAPSVAIRWSDLMAVDESGHVVRPVAVLVNYQAVRERGCPNTSVAMDEAGGLLQITNIARTVEQGARLVL